ncbi:putative zn 2cys6 transcription factor protein [Erysiphe necator]|uniref:Putative zn 2cys6 transcription factor protein n=1 Tax=Uncinula necator TaxID=52586 RepID=A0A0B1PG47_UNCNE|nr:putative zn 2cys6 transcription factor protein [Erysiphe necator]
MIVTSPNVPARWRAEFLGHISKMPSPELAFSTLHHNLANDHAPITPRTRFCVYRGMWGELPENPRNPAKLNDRVYQSELLTITTDVRMVKIPDIFDSGSENGKIDMSGGGGPVEAVFWIKEAATQWRFIGEAFVVGNDIDDELSSGAKFVKRSVVERMRVVKASGKENWSWSQELTAHFGNLSPRMRGSFKNPAPGAPISSALDNPELKLGQRINDLHDAEARKNFRVIIIMPKRVEKLDLGSPAESQRRWVYTYNMTRNDDQLDSWSEEECWP